MRATKAREILVALIEDPSFRNTIDPVRDRKIVEALCSVGDELPKQTLSRAVKTVGDSTNWELLIDAARKNPPAPAGELIATTVGKKKDLWGAFFKHAHAAGAGAEAAQFAVEMRRSPHLPSLVKRLAKMPAPSEALVAAATKTLSARPKANWFDLVDFLPCCALMGVLIRSGEPSASSLVDRVAASLERQLSDDEIREPQEVVARLRKGLGAAPAADEKPKAKKAANPVVVLAAKQGFSVASKTDWHAKVWLARGEPNEWFGALQQETQLLLKLDAKHKPFWEVTIRPKKGYRRYHNLSGRVTQDDFGLPPLGDLGDLPAWLPKAGKELKTSFTPAKAKISTGRYRKLAAELRAWLEG